MIQNSIEHTASRLKAMSNPVRLRILHYLHQEGEVCVGDLETHIGLSQSAVSQHLRILRDTYLVATRRDGVIIHYRLDREQISDALAQTILLIKD